MALTRSLTLHQFRSVVQGLPAELTAAVRRGLLSSAMRAKSIVVQEIDNALPYPAVNVGQLRNSVRWSKTPQGGSVSVDAPHAPMIEHGTRPFTPPIEPLKIWAARKFGLDDREAERVAWAVRRKIERQGIAPRHYFRKAMRRVRDEIVPVEIRLELERL